MKLKFFLMVLVALMSFSHGYASFPVQRAMDTNFSITDAEDKEEILTSPAATSTAEDKMLIAGLLWFFLGGFAGHRWYLGSPIGWNLLFIVTLGGLGVWWIIDGIDIFTKRYPGL